jgi:hypothetical protein
LAAGIPAFAPLLKNVVRIGIVVDAHVVQHLCERNAVLGNPVDGVKRPMANNNEGSTPALGDAQARRLLEARPRTR